MLFVVEGSINVLDFIASDLVLDVLYASAEWIHAHHRVLPIEKSMAIDARQMKKISALSSPSEVLAVFQMPLSTTIDLETLDELILVLDGIKDPGNMGTIIRTADWFGVKHIICSTDCADAFGSKVVQASMGSLARVKVHSTDLLELMNNRPESWITYGAYLEGDDIQEVSKNNKSLLVIGSEAHGISDYLEFCIDQKINIPMHRDSGAESLNASIATGILCYAFRM